MTAPTDEGNDDVVDLDSYLLFVQLNDIYHIDSRADYSVENSLILPRVSTIVQRLRKCCGTRAIFCLPGDFLGPSCLSRETQGEQMVDILNLLGLDFVTFGNHEFDEDFTTSVLLQRLNQSNFKWVCSNFEFDVEHLANLFDSSGKYFPSWPIWLSDANVVVVFGFLYEDTFSKIGRTHTPIEHLQEFIEVCKTEILDSIKDRLLRQDINLTVIALTHQRLRDDIAMALACPEVRLIMGGHDHDVIKEDRTTGCLITKAASNARTIRFNWIVAVPCESVNRLVQSEGSLEAAMKPILRGVMRTMHRAIFFDSEQLPERVDKLRIAEYADTGGLVEAPRITSHLVGDEWIVVFSLAMDTTNERFSDVIPEDPNVAERIRKWLNHSGEGNERIARAGIHLCLQDKVIRRKSTNFGNFVADIVRGVYQPLDPIRVESDIGLINGGSFRLGRDINAGEYITRRTLCDIFFYRNEIRVYSLAGEDIKTIIEKCAQLRETDDEDGNGDFLQISGLRVQLQGTQVVGIELKSLFGQLSALQADRIYTVATTDYIADQCKEYSPIFKGKPIVVIGEDLRASTEVELKELDGTPSMLWEVKLDDTRRWLWN